MSVRVRFAPSPTGLLHLGGARTALFNYFYALSNEGQCILRLEDTDQGRSVSGSREGLEEALQWLGIKFHESPSKGGPYGPYVQSERLPLYQKYARGLLQKGSGYPCFCSKERLQSLRGQGQQDGYDGRCRSLSKRQADEEMDRGTPFTIRLKVPHDVMVVIDDVVYGRVKVSSSTIEDQVLLKTDGFPTYHLASVVDDHCMDISHVLRGEEWLLSTAKHSLVYSGLGWSAPVFAHLPLLLSRVAPVFPIFYERCKLLVTTGEKLSKRQHGASVQSYQKRGFLAEAVTELLSQLGWNSRAESCKAAKTLEETGVGFSLDGISQSPVSVDEEKLMWINKKHFRRRLQEPSSCRELSVELAECVKTTLGVPPDSNTLTTEYLSQVLQILEDRMSLIPHIPVDAEYFWRAPTSNKEAIHTIDNAALLKSRETTICLEKDEVVLKEIVERLSKMDDFSQSRLTLELKGVSSSLCVPHKTTMQLCRAAVIGQETSPGVAGVCEVLGRATVLDRLQRTINTIS